MAAARFPQHDPYSLNNHNHRSLGVAPSGNTAATAALQGWHSRHQRSTSAHFMGTSVANAAALKAVSGGCATPGPVIPRRASSTAGIAGKPGKTGSLRPTTSASMSHRRLASGSVHESPAFRAASESIKPSASSLSLNASASASTTESSSTKHKPYPTSNPPVSDFSMDRLPATNPAIRRTATVSGRPSRSKLDAPLKPPGELPVKSHRKDSLAFSVASSSSTPASSSVANRGAPSENISRTKSLPLRKRHDTPLSLSQSHALSAATHATARDPSRYGTSSIVLMDPAMFTSHPPITPKARETEDKIHESALILAMRIYERQNQMNPKSTSIATNMNPTTAASAALGSSPSSTTTSPQSPTISRSHTVGHGSTTSTTSPQMPSTLRLGNVEQTAYRITQQRLSELDKSVHESHRWSSSSAHQNKRHSLTSILRRPTLLRRSSSDGELDRERRRGQVNPTTATSPRSPIVPDEHVMELAKQNVASTLSSMQEQAEEPFGTSPTTSSLKARAHAKLTRHHPPSNRGHGDSSHGESSHATTEAQPRNRYAIGGGKFMTHDEVTALATQTTKPLFDDIEERARFERDRKKAIQAEQEAAALAKKKNRKSWIRASLAATSLDKPSTDKVTKNTEVGDSTTTTEQQSVASSSAQPSGKPLPQPQPPSRHGILHVFSHKRSETLPNMTAALSKSKMHTEPSPMKTSATESSMPSSPIVGPPSRTPTSPPTSPSAKRRFRISRFFESGSKESLSESIDKVSSHSPPPPPLPSTSTSRRAWLKNLFTRTASPPPGSGHGSSDGETRGFVGGIALRRNTAQANGPGPAQNGSSGSITHETPGEASAQPSTHHESPSISALSIAPSSLVRNHNNTHSSTPPPPPSSKTVSTPPTQNKREAGSDSDTNTTISSPPPANKTATTVPISSSSSSSSLLSSLSSFASPPTQTSTTATATATTTTDPTTSQHLTVPPPPRSATTTKRGIISPLSVTDDASPSSKRSPGISRFQEILD